jgi:polyhydroxybutyrate depolymerase
MVSINVSLDYRVDTRTEAGEQTMKSKWFSRRIQHSAYVIAAIALLSMQGEAMTSGCMKRDARMGISDQTTTDGNDTARAYLLQVPDNYKPKRAYPLIFVFHGAGGTAEQSRAAGLQNVPGASENAIFVFPQGIDFHHQGVGWDDSGHGYDMKFFDNMIDATESGYCIDAAEIFVAGFSWGGDFATSLACKRGDTIRAIAANSTSDEYSDKSNYWTYEGLPCSSHIHPAIRFEHAVEGDSSYPAPEFATTAELFRYFDRCNSASKPIPSKTSTESCVSFRGCAHQVIECSFDKSIGHKLPPNWARDTWEFFQSFQH